MAQVSAVKEMSPHILVVEDDPAIAEVVCYNLAAEGFRSAVAVTGEEAEMQVEEELFDLIVLDWMLPGLSGIEFCRRLRRRETTKNVPVLMLTARSEEGDRVRGLATGAIDAIATDHAPHHAASKDVEFEKAPFGITGFETALALGLAELVHTVSARASVNGPFPDANGSAAAAGPPARADGPSHPG